MSTLNIGARIVCEGYFGTVRYLGNVEGSSAPNWVGVEWDDSTRGKHDGSHNGMNTSQTLQHLEHNTLHISTSTTTSTLNFFYN